MSSEAQPQQQRLVVGGDRRAEVDRRRTGRDGAVRQILARAEAASRTGQHEAADLRIANDLVDRGAHFAVHQVVKLFSRSGRFSVSVATPSAHRGGRSRTIAPSGMSPRPGPARAVERRCRFVDRPFNR